MLVPLECCISWPTFQHSRGCPHSIVRDLGRRVVPEPQKILWKIVFAIHSEAGQEQGSKI